MLRQRVTGKQNPAAGITDLRTTAKWRRDELISLLSTSSELAGLCITVVALMNTYNKARADVTVVDDMLAVCAAVFLLCITLYSGRFARARPAYRRHCSM
jgi:hypothetical protein